MCLASPVMQGSYVVLVYFVLLETTHELQDNGVYGKKYE